MTDYMADKDELPEHDALANIIAQKEEDYSNTDTVMGPVGNFTSSPHGNASI